MSSQREFIDKARAASDYPTDNPVDQLRHVVELYADAKDDETVISGTYGVWGHGVATGLTWGDLRKIYELVKP